MPLTTLIQLDDSETRSVQEQRDKRTRDQVPARDQVLRAARDIAAIAWRRCRLCKNRYSMKRERAVVRRWLKLCDRERERCAHDATVSPGAMRAMLGAMMLSGWSVEGMG